MASDAAATSSRAEQPLEVSAKTARWHRFGGSARVAVILVNRGADAVEAQLAISLGVSIAFEALGPGGGPCSEGRVVVCELGAIAPGEVRSLELRVRARAPVLYTHVTAVLATATDPDAAVASARFSVCSHLGTSAADVLTGTSRRDVICARGGGDRILGRGGGDHVDAGAGDDGIALGRGRNVVFAGSGRDLVRGGPGRDAVDAGRGPDHVFGLAGPDALSGEDGDDVLLGGRGDDELTGWSGRDRLAGGRGDDLLDALDEARDVVDGGCGRDLASVDRVDRLTSARRGEFLLGWKGFE